MNTKFKDITGTIVNVETHQYAVGLYILITEGNHSEQYNSNMNEKDFHINLRKQCIENKGILLNGTIIPYKGKCNINKFEERITDIVPDEIIIHSTGK